MRTYILLLLTFFVQAIVATRYPYKSSFYGCPRECKTEKLPKCEHGIPSNRFFVALHPDYFKSRPYKYCDNYWVGMIIDSKAKGKYKMVRAKVVDQCGSCHPTQVDLSQDVFETLAHVDTGVVDMVYVIVNKDTSEIMDGPHYNSDALKHFAEKQGVSRETIIESFKEAAKNLNKQGGKGMSSFPWKSGKFDKEEHKEEHKEHKEERKTTTTRRTTTRRTTRRTTTKRTTTTTTKKHTTTEKIDIVKTVSIKPVDHHPKVTPKPVVPEPVVPEPIVPEDDVEEEAPKAPVAPVTPKAKPATPKAPVKPAAPKKPAKADDELDEFDKNNGGTNAPVTASVISVGVVGAAGLGLLVLKRKSPQKYDDLKQKFPEAFGNVKRSLTRGASTIKRGVSRSVSRRSNTQNNAPLPASYTFTLSSEDGLPRVALYDDPYPTKTHGTQHW